MVQLLAAELRVTDYGLVKRRAELACQTEETHNRFRKMIEDLEKLTPLSAIRPLAPS
jgi:hypothetical protein